MPGRHEPGQSFAAFRVEERKRCSEIILVDGPREHHLVGEDELGAEIADAVGGDPGGLLERQRDRTIPLVDPPTRPPGLSWTSSSHGARACSRSQIWPAQVGGRGRRSSSGRRVPLPAAHMSRRPRRCSLSAPTSRRKMVASMSLCARETPVNASIAQPPEIHHGLSNPSSTVAASRGSSCAQGPQRRWNSRSSGSSTSRVRESTGRARSPRARRRSPRCRSRGRGSDSPRRARASRRARTRPGPRTRDAPRGT